MALSTPTFAGSGTDTNGTATSTSFNTTVTANTDDLLVFLGGSQAGVTLSSVSCGGLTWTVSDTIARGAVVGTGIAYATAPSGLASGTGLTATWSATGTGHQGSVYIVSGAATSSIRDAGNTVAPAATATPTVTGIVTTNANDIIIAVRCANDNTVDAGWTAGASYTKCPSGTLNLTTVRTTLMEYQIVASAGTRTASLTQTAVACAMAATAFKEGAAVATVLPERVTARTHPI